VRTWTRSTVSRFENGSSSRIARGRGRAPGPAPPAAAGRPTAWTAAVGEPAEAHQLERLGDPAAAALLAGQPVADVVAHGEVREQRPVLEHHADPTVLRPHVHTGAAHRAVDLDLAVVDALETGDRAQQRGLAAAARAEQGHRLAGPRRRARRHAARRVRRSASPPSDDDATRPGLGRVAHRGWSQATTAPRGAHQSDPALPSTEWQGAGRTQLRREERGMHQLGAQRGVRRPESTCRGPPTRSDRVAHRAGTSREGHRRRPLVHPGGHDQRRCSASTR
jgi:hypothetical protein